MDRATLIGTVAGMLTTFSLLPQVIRIRRLRAAEEVSAATFATMGAGVGLWVVYGVEIRSAPVIVFNSLSLVLTLAILVLKRRYRK